MKSLSPAWWGAIAGAVAAGASLLPDARLVGGALGGVAMFFVAKKLAEPCCAECAAAEAGGASLVKLDGPQSLATSDAACPDCDAEMGQVFS